MNREIEFRGVCIDTKEWVYGYYVKGSKRHCIQKSLAYYPIFNIIPETLGQYTGLKDCNGVKIFEGDIIHHDSIVDNADYVVEYKEGVYCGVRNNKYRSEEKIYLKLYMVELSNLEVIGNIYEKELQKD